MPPPTVGEVIGGYRLERALGAGAAARVFLATHLRLGRRVAIKVLTGGVADEERAIARFVAEAKVVNDIGHPNIIDISDFLDGEPGRMALVMELIEGPSLKRLRVEGRRLSFVQAVGVTLQLIDALEAAHAIGVIHRDLKPDNLLLAEEVPADTHLIPWLKVVDFGIAKINEGGVEHTATGIMIGTPAYMAPEQIAGKPPPSPATDVYAVGELLYELLTGLRAFPQGTINETVQAKLRGQIPQLERLQVPGAVQLEALVVRCLDRHQEGRPRLAELRGTLLQVCPEAEHYAFRPAPTSHRPRSEAETVEPPPAPPGPDTAISPRSELRAGLLATVPIPGAPTTVDRPPPVEPIAMAPVMPSEISASGPAETAVTQLGETRLATPSGAVVVVVDESVGSPFDDATTAVGLFASLPRQLAQSAGQRPIRVAGLLVAVAALAVLSVWALRPDARPAPEAASAPKVAPSPAVQPLPQVEVEARSTRIEVVSMPAGARVEDAETGALLGVTPLSLELPGATRKRARIALEDHDPVVVWLSPASAHVEVELVKRASPPRARRGAESKGNDSKPPPAPAGDFPSW